MFSVLMSLYSKEKPDNLDQCLSSLYTQTRKADEIILVYDGPVTAELQAIVEKWQPLLMLTLLKLEKNVGLGNALNAGLNRCTHDLVARMDTDDICLPQRFEKQIAFMDENPEVSLLGVAVIEFDEHGKERLKSLPVTYSEIRRFARLKNPFNHMCVVFRKQAVISAGSYQHHLFMEDYNLWLRMMAEGQRMANLSDVLMRVRAGSEMVSKRRGWPYIKSEIQLFKLKKKLKQVPLLQGSIYFLIRTSTRVIPTGLMKYLYEKDRGK